MTLEMLSRPPGGSVIDEARSTSQLQTSSVFASYTDWTGMEVTIPARTPCEVILSIPNRVWSNSVAGRTILALRDASNVDVKRATIDQHATANEGPPLCVVFAVDAFATERTLKLSGSVNVTSTSTLNADSAGPILLRAKRV